MHIDPAVVPGPVKRAVKRKPRRSTGERLREAVMFLAGGKARVETHTERSWASITFAGTRHRMVLVFEGAEACEAGESFIAFLPEHEFTIPGQLVADAAVVEVDHTIAPEPLMRVMCELLLLEED